MNFFRSVSSFYHVPFRVVPFLLITVLSKMNSATAMLVTNLNWDIIWHGPDGSGAVGCMDGHFIDLGGKTELVLKNRSCCVCSKNLGELFAVGVAQETHAILRFHCVGHLHV